MEVYDSLIREVLDVLDYEKEAHTRSYKICGIRITIWLYINPGSKMIRKNRVGIQYSGCYTLTVVKTKVCVYAGHVSDTEGSEPIGRVKCRRVPKIWKPLVVLIENYTRKAYRLQKHISSTA